MRETIVDLLKDATDNYNHVWDDFYDEYDRGYASGRLDGLRDAKSAVAEQVKTSAESRLIEALIAERNGVHSLPVKMALRAVKAERGM